MEVSGRGAAGWGWFMSAGVWHRMWTLAGVTVLGLGMVTAPGTATVAAKTVPGRTLVMTVTGLPSGTTARVKVRGPKDYTATLRVDDTARLTKLHPGRYTLTAKAVGKATATDPVKKVRIKKNRGARVRFVYTTSAANTTPPRPVTNLRVTERTSVSIGLAWKNPPDGDFLEVEVIRKGGTDAETGDLVLADDGTSLRETGLVPDTTYTYTITTIDEAGNVSAGVSITVRTLPA